MSGRYARLRGLALGACLLAIAGMFVAWHLGSSSDGARLEPGQPVWTANGVVVTPLDKEKTPLLPGDVVVAVDGRSLQAWAEALFQPGSLQLFRPAPHPLNYTVLRDGQPITLVVAPVPYPLRAIVERNWSTLLFTLITQLVMTIVFLLRPHDRAAWALFVLAFSLSHAYSWAFGLQLADVLGGVGYWLYQVAASGLWSITWGAALEFALVFPHPHPGLLNRRWLVPLIYASSFFIFILFLLLTRLLTPNILEWLGGWLTGNWVVAILFEILTAYFILTGYRSTRDQVARKKVRWLLYGFAVTAAIQVGAWFLPGIVLGRPLIDASTLGLTLLPIPIILAVAVVRYQLFDIDVIIRRTLIYTMLTGILALLYFGSVVLLEQVLRALTGQGSDLAIVVSTLVIAALAVPLRNRIQRLIDRRFYRRKYDAGKVLAAFAANVRDEVDLKRLTDELQSVVEETMHPEHVSLWLKDSIK